MRSSALSRKQHHTRDDEGRPDAADEGELLREEERRADDGYDRIGRARRGHLARRSLRQRVEKDDERRRGAEGGRGGPGAARAQGKPRAVAEYEDDGEADVEERHPENQLLPGDRP